jgi:hypothetical protein
MFVIQIKYQKLQNKKYKVIKHPVIGIKIYNEYLYTNIFR